MSKVDAQRAMREARYAAMQTQAGSPQTRSPQARSPQARSTEEVSEARSTKRAAASAEELCGHRGSAGKPCVRPARHTEKSHRYA